MDYLLKYRANLEIEKTESNVLNQLLSNIFRVEFCSKLEL